MTVRSNPPGAMLYIDNQEIGTTPVSASFIYYGTREFRLVKDGYETRIEKRTIPVPWYEFTPLDFIAENLVPGQIRDRHTLDFQLVPQREYPTEEILEQAEALRRQTRGPGTIQVSPPPRPPATTPAGPWPSAPSAAGSVAPPTIAPGVPPGVPPTFTPSAPPAVPPGIAPPFAPGAPPSYPPAPAANDMLPYPTEPPGGWQPRG